MKFKYFFFLLIIINVNQCRTYYDYKPKLIDNSEEARKILYEIIQSQPARRAPQELELKNDFMKMITHVKRTGVSFPITQTVYFSKIGEIKYFKRKQFFVISIYDKSEIDLYHVYTSNKIDAEKFINALHTMIKLNSTN